VFTARYGLDVYIQFRLIFIFGLSLRGAGFGPEPVHVSFVADKVALGQVFLPILRSSPVGIIPPTLHTHLHLHVGVTITTNGRSLRNFQKALFVWKLGSAG
jgi:hypothetical protein